MTHRLVTGFTLAAALVAMSPASQQSVSAEVAAPESRPPALNFTLKKAKGKPAKLADYKGKVLLLDFWATWCTGCKQEIPWFQEFQTKYNSKGLMSLGVAMDEEGWPVVTPFLKQHPINYPVVVHDEAFDKLFPIMALPITLLIDRNGRVADSHAGVVDKDAWEAEIQTLLRER
jgi:cytochrome c biogenesis protein CcmG/thiol:disulfide interchange protein DsbE